MQDAEPLAGLPTDILTVDPGEDGAGPTGERGAPRLRRADRAQVRMLACSLDELLPPDHAARTVWAVVQKLDTSGFEAPLLARGSDPGRAATDPKILIALWLYAATEGVGSGRELARLCEEHTAYQWILGGVSINYHTLNDFRVGHGAALDKLFTTLLTTLMHRGVVPVRRLAQDGTRVRASAGAASFHRRQTLERDLAKAREHVEALKRQQEAEVSAREQAAQERAAREHQERIEAALRALPQIEAAFEKRSPRRKAEAQERGTVPRASTTDPEARPMRMPDGGYRPAYNVQLVADTESRAIVGVKVGNNGSDMGQAPPLLDQVVERTGGKVEEVLLDGGFLHLATIDELAEKGVTVYAPVMESKNAQGGPHTARPGDSEAVAAWRTRMATPEAKAIYKERGSTIEPINGDLKTFRGLTQFTVRGLAKVTSVVLWSVLAYTLMRFGGHLLAA